MWDPSTLLPGVGTTVAALQALEDEDSGGSSRKSAEIREASSREVAFPERSEESADIAASVTDLLEGDVEEIIYRDGSSY